jgi:hypothetical protein
MMMNDFEAIDLRSLARVAGGASAGRTPEERMGIVSQRAAERELAQVRGLKRYKMTRAEAQDWNERQRKMRGMYTPGTFICDPVGGDRFTTGSAESCGLGSGAD